MFTNIKRVHQAPALKEQTYECEKGNYQTSNAGNLTCHRKRHGPVVHVPCDQCGNLITQLLVADHKTKRCPNRPIVEQSHPCPYCPRIFQHRQVRLQQTGVARTRQDMITFFAADASSSFDGVNTLFTTDTTLLASSPLVKAGESIDCPPYEFRHSSG